MPILKITVNRTTRAVIASEIVDDRFQPNYDELARLLAKEFLKQGRDVIETSKEAQTTS